MSQHNLDQFKGIRIRELTSAEYDEIDKGSGYSTVIDHEEQTEFGAERFRVLHYPMVGYVAQYTFCGHDDAEMYLVEYHEITPIDLLRRAVVAFYHHGEAEYREGTK